MPRTNLSDQFDAAQRQAYKPKIVCRNTFRFERDGATVFRLHDTDIVELKAGKAILNSGGWKTVTTKDRMNAYSGYNVYSDKGLWYVAPRGSHNGVAYFDGMILPDAFRQTSKGKKTEKRETALRESIRKFVAKLDGLKELPVPNNGDCWLCSMTVSSPTKDKGKTWGDASGDKSHILEHVKQGYLHGSLIWNALVWAGYRNPSAVWHPIISFTSQPQYAVPLPCGR